MYLPPQNYVGLGRNHYLWFPIKVERDNKQNAAYFKRGHGIFNVVLIL